MQVALAQAKEGREHILGEMQKAMPHVKTELSDFAPRLITIKINLDNHNVLSKHRRKQYAARVPEAAMDLIESEARAARAEVAQNGTPDPDEESPDDQAEGSRL